MRQIAKLPDEARSELFRNVADKMGLKDAIVEKDFWVCFALDYLFHRCPYKDSITFKGGTSLSKAFHLISRFSEDIDLILDWRELGYAKEEPWEKRSNTNKMRSIKKRMRGLRYFWRINSPQQSKRSFRENWASRRISTLTKMISRPLFSLILAFLPMLSLCRQFAWK